MTTKKSKPSKYATLTFDLTDPYAHEDFIVHTKAIDMKLALYDIAVKLREYRKYKTYNTQAETDLVHEIEEQFYAICKDHDIDPY